ncbi:MAG: S1C family serine protease [Muribaculaceae bacterium]|nr:S1C family serine protease [Muribaculaceae bacterium]
MIQKVNRFYIISAMTIIWGLSSCAHKSGHRPRTSPVGRTQSSPDRGTGISNLDKTGNDPKMEDKRDLEVPVNEGKRDKLDGSQIFAKYNSAVFMVFTSDGFNGYQGSGFFINSSGLAVSNYHVFKGTAIGAEQIKLVGSDQPYKVAEVIHSDEEEDFIVFRVNVSNSNYIPIASKRPLIGEKVYAIGSPRGLENTFSSGEVSQWRDRNLMQISALIDHGSSGGALINEYGEVVGITSGSFYDGSQANLNYAWSIDVVKPYINSH